LGQPSKFHRVARVSFVAAPTLLSARQPDLHNVWLSPGLVHYIYISGALAPKGILAGAKITLLQSYVILYWQLYCAALEQWASAKLCSMVFSRDRAAIPFDIGRSNCLVDYILQ